MEHSDPGLADNTATTCYLELLNEQQRQAVVYRDGPALVIAGAGSGKTRVLTYKIVDLLAHGYEPYRILALTFTNKAAREMKERIAAVTGAQTAGRIWMGTFHSVFLRILRHHAELLGFKPQFTIYDSADSRSLIKSIIKDLALDDKAYKPSTIQSIISNAKNALMTASDYCADRDMVQADKRANRPMTGTIFRHYTERCRAAQAMDFDDILFFMNKLLRDFPDVRRHYEEFFRYILVDEYQDTNFAQHLIISQLAGEQQHLCVVGDDAQSIYSFRGANIANILNLRKFYPTLQIFKLERNYRSTRNIIDAAGSLIAKNTRQMPKNVYSENDKGEPIEVVSTYSDMEEAYVVANAISRSRLTEHDGLDEYAVLYRTNAQSRVLEESLRKRNIPYRIYGAQSFYQRKEVKDAICYFRLTVNPDDDEALRRVINYPARGIGETTLKKLTHAATEAGVSIWTVISNPDTYDTGVNTGTARKLAGFRDMILDFIADNGHGSNAYDLARLIYNRTGLLAQFAHDNTPESISRQENLTEMLAGLKDFVDTRLEGGDNDVSMSSFLSEVSLATDQDQTDNDEPKVTLMTVHAAKGLEFKHVYIVGVEEELFPSAMAMDTLAEVEEERRLLYVALTRAKETCMLTFAGSRFRNGATVMTRPSRFLNDIDARYLHLQTSSDMPAGAVSRLFVNPVANYRQNSFTRRFGSRNDMAATDRTTHSRQTVSHAAEAVQQAWEPAAHTTATPQNTAAPHQSLPGDNGGRIHFPDEVSAGRQIIHNRFGKGTITQLSESTGDPVIIVDFENFGTKKLLLKYARFSLI